MIIVYNILNFALIGLNNGYTKDAVKRSTEIRKGVGVFGTGAPSKLMYKKYTSLYY